MKKVLKLFRTFEAARGSFRARAMRPGEVIDLTNLRVINEEVGYIIYFKHESSALRGLEFDSVIIEENIKEKT